MAEQSRAEALQIIREEMIGRMMSTIIGGVTYHGEVREVIWHPLEKCYKAKCKFFNEESYFYKNLSEGDNT